MGEAVTPGQGPQFGELAMSDALLHSQTTGSEQNPAAPIPIPLPTTPSFVPIPHPYNPSLPPPPRGDQGGLPGPARLAVGR